MHGQSDTNTSDLQTDVGRVCVGLTVLPLSRRRRTRARSEAATL